MLKSYPQLTAESVEEALKYAAQSVKNDSFGCKKIHCVKALDFPLLADENVHPDVIVFLRGGVEGCRRSISEQKW
ncbi:MAG: hypothetical protein U0X92_13410 [Anaerolineales bacterium]